MNLFQKYFIYILEKRYLDIKGRSSRAEYWYFLLFCCLSLLVIILGFVAVFCILLSLVIGKLTSGWFLPSLVPIILRFSILVLLLPCVCLTIRRLHDTGRSAWWILLLLIPYLGAFIILTLMLLEGDAKPNRYGSSPILRKAI